MSVGNITSSSYESMIAKFESFRSGKSTLQKADLEQIQSDSTNKTAAEGMNELIAKFSQIDTNGDGMSLDELKTAGDSGTISKLRPPTGGLGSVFNALQSGQATVQMADLENLKSSQSTDDTKGTAEIDELISKFSQIDTNGDGISEDELKAALDSGTITKPTRPEGGMPPGGMGKTGGPGGARGPGGPPPGGKPEETEETDDETTSTGSTTSAATTLLELLKKMAEDSQKASEENSSKEAKTFSQKMALMFAQQLEKAYGQKGSSNQNDYSSMLGMGVTA